MIIYRPYNQKKSFRIITTLIALQAVLCGLETYFISKISLIGKIGIALVHKEYMLLRSGWKTFLLFFAIQVAVIIVLAVVERKNNRRIMRYTAWGFILAALLGLIITYLDFLHTYSHRLLKERFHLGFYLFWLGWIGSSVVFLIKSYPLSSGFPLAETTNYHPGEKDNERTDNNDHISI